MWPQERDEARSDLEVSICGPNHSGWCKYCRALAQIQAAVSDEREACAKVAEFLTEQNVESDWQEGFNMACQILAHVIRARSSQAAPEKVARSFKQLSHSIATARMAKQHMEVTPGGHAGNCSLAVPSLFSSAGTPAR
jgi:hypothetical protein